MKFISVLIAILKMILPWGAISTGIYLLAPDPMTGVSRVMIALGVLYLIDVYLNEYGKR